MHPLWHINVMLVAYIVLLILLFTRNKSKEKKVAKVTLTESQKKIKDSLPPECIDKYYWVESEETSFRWLGWVLFGLLVFARFVYCFIIQKTTFIQFLNPVNIPPEQGYFGVHWYSLGFLFAFVLGYKIMDWIFRKEYISPVRLQDLLIYLFIAILGGARFGHCLFYDAEEYFKNGLNIATIILPIDKSGQFVGFQGLASHGAAIGIVLAVFLYQLKYKLNAWWFFDRLVIVVALGGAFVRLGNLFNSEIYGTATTLPWGFIFERNGETVAKHPTGLYEALSYLAIFAVSFIYYCKKKGQLRTGTIFGWWLVALFGARFLIEFVKTNGVVDGSPLLLGQWLSLPFIVGGLVIVWLSRRNMLPQGPVPWGEVTTTKNDNKK